MLEVRIVGPRGDAWRARVALARRERARGLRDRPPAGDEAMLFPDARVMHTVGMSAPIRIAHLDAHLRVVAARDVRPGRIAVGPPGSRHVLEARTGADLRVGDALAILRTLPPRRGRVGSGNARAPIV